MHASITDGGFNCIFAFFLILPDQAGAAAGHDTGNAVVDTDQIFASIFTTIKTVEFLIIVGYWHFA